MKPLQFGIIFIMGIALGFSLAIVQPSLSGLFVAQPIGTTLVEPIFSPGSQDVPINLVRAARSNVALEVYSFTSIPLKEELIAATNRGVNVNVILEKSISSNPKMARELRAAGVKVRWGDPRFSLTHAKFLVVDGQIVFVGSNNWTFHSFNLNREAGVKLTDVGIAKRFVDVFNTDWNNGQVAG